MSISLAGPTQGQTDCTHHWDIVCSIDINPKTGKAYGQNTPGTCRKCGLERVFSSRAIQHAHDDFKVAKAPE